MRKIPTLYVRDPGDLARVTSEVHPDCTWVLEPGRAVATRKFDGTCTKRDLFGQWWARREVKPGKVVPPGFVEEEIDPVTHKMVGWEPMAQSSFAKAFGSVDDVPDLPRTYELCGPKINGNPEGYPKHVLIPHGLFRLLSPAHDVDAVMDECRDKGYEGVVWHEMTIDGARLAKLKVRDLT